MRSASVRTLATRCEEKRSSDLPLRIMETLAVETPVASAMSRRVGLLLIGTSGDNTRRETFVLKN